MYQLIRKFLFTLPAESAHDLALKSLQVSAPFWKLIQGKVNKPVNVLGLSFDNPVGLAAGLDKNASYIDGIAAQGFGFIEVGTITPKPQEGNPKPRMFRLEEHQAIINRMGFNNEGVDAMVANIKASTYYQKKQGVLGVNIGKNKATSNESAVDDYLHCLNKVYELADYITVNLSSPNTPDLRALQFGEPLTQLLITLKSRQAQLHQETGRYVPLLLKIAPDMESADIEQIAQQLVDANMDGVIATNTTVDRDLVAGHKCANEAGGLSGKPVREKSQQTLDVLHQALAGKMPIIAVGGISSVGDLDAIRGKADLIQIYTSYIFQGPELVKKLAKAF